MSVYGGGGRGGGIMFASDGYEMCACMIECKCLHTQANTSARVHFADNGPTMEPETDPGVSQHMHHTVCHNQ